jgi:hypothetical protein
MHISPHVGFASRGGSARKRFFFMKVRGCPPYDQPPRPITASSGAATRSQMLIMRRGSLPEGNSLAACADQVKDGAEDSSRIGRFMSGRLANGQQWLHQRKLLVR